MTECRWCDKPIAREQLRVTLPSGALVHWGCALIAADRGLLERPTGRQFRMIDGMEVPA